MEKARRGRLHRLSADWSTHARYNLEGSFATLYPYFLLILHAQECNRPEGYV